MGQGRTRPAVLLLTVLLAVLTLAGCGSDPSASPSATDSTRGAPGSSPPGSPGPPGSSTDGPSVPLRLKSGTQPGSRYRVRGKGIETKKATGDLIATIDVVVPTSLSVAQRSAIEQLAAASAGAGASTGAAS